MIIERLQYHYFEHKYYVKRLSAGIGFPFSFSNSLQRFAKLLPVDYPVELNERVTAIVELLESCLPVEKSSLNHLQSFAYEMKNRNSIVKELNISSV